MSRSECIVCRQKASHHCEPTYGFSNGWTYRLCSCIGCICSTSFHQSGASRFVLHKCSFAFSCFSSQRFFKWCDERLKENSKKETKKERNPRKVKVGTVKLGFDKNQRKVDNKINMMTIFSLSKDYK